MNENNEVYMRRALELARKGLGRTSPNPCVGCVIVKDNKIIAEGYHKKAGEDHAEIDALRKIHFKAKGCTLYVTLEPCSHFGKTPPCTQSIIKSGVTRVVFASSDPNPLVDSKSELEHAKIAVIAHVLREEADKLNEAFFCSIRKKRPFFTLKLAMSLDGKIAERKGKQTKITTEHVDRITHKMRSELDGVLVGIGTILSDNPQLNVRHVAGEEPCKIILDTTLKIPLNSNVVSHGNKTIILTSSKSSLKKKKALEEKGVRVLICKMRGKSLDLQDVPKKLHAISLNSILIEGGPRIAASFLQEGLIDKAILWYAPFIMGNRGLNGLILKTHGKKTFFKNWELTPVDDHIRIEGYL